LIRGRDIMSGDNKRRSASSLTLPDITDTETYVTGAHRIFSVRVFLFFMKISRPVKISRPDLDKGSGKEKEMTDLRSPSCERSRMPYMFAIFTPITPKGNYRTVATTLRTLYVVYMLQYVTSHFLSVKRSGIRQ